MNLILIIKTPKNDNSKGKNPAIPVEGSRSKKARAFNSCSELPEFSTIKSNPTLTIIKRTLASTPAPSTVCPVCKTIAMPKTKISFPTPLSSTPRCTPFPHSRWRISLVFRWGATTARTGLRISHCHRNRHSKVILKKTLPKSTILSVRRFVIHLVDEYSSNNGRLMFPMNFNLAVNN